MSIRDSIQKIDFSFFKNTRNLLWIFLLVALGASIHRLFLGFDHIQNFLIFRSAFFNLIASKDLYTSNSYGEISLDLFKYSPSFALLFAPFALLPVTLGYILWNLVNALALVLAIRSLKTKENTTWLILILVFIDFLTSLQNAQSNALMAALMIASFNALENKRPFRAALFILLSSFIKIFSLAAFLLFLFYPEKKNFIIGSVLFSLLILASPLVLVSMHQLIFLYESWFALLKNDQAISEGLSVMGILHTWFGLELSRTAIQVVGALLLCLPLIRIKAFMEFETRILFLCSILIWVVIFNHRAESPSFIIAMCGIAIWYCQGDRTKMKTSLLITALLLMSLSPTDLFPRYIRTEYIVPYCLKALPAILIWSVIQYRLIQKCILNSYS